MLARWFALRGWTCASFSPFFFLATPYLTFEASIPKSPLTLLLFHIVFSLRLSTSTLEAVICLSVWSGLYIAREGARGLPQPIPLIQPNFAYHQLALFITIFVFISALPCGSSPCMSPFNSPFDLSASSPYCRPLRFLRLETHLIPLQLPSFFFPFHRTIVVVVVIHSVQ